VNVSACNSDPDKSALQHAAHVVLGRCYIEEPLPLCVCLRIVPINLFAGGFDGGKHHAIAEVVIVGDGCTSLPVLVVVAAIHFHHGFSKVHGAYLSLSGKLHLIFEHSGTRIPQGIPRSDRFSFQDQWELGNRSAGSRASQSLGLNCNAIVSNRV